MAKHLTGRIEAFPLIDLFQFLELQHASGRLEIRRGVDLRTVDWKGGNIIYVSGTRPEDRLGTALAEARTISLPSLYRVFARHLGSNEKLTRTLLEEGLMERELLAGLTEKLAQRLLHELLTWPSGSFEFDTRYQTEDILRIDLNIKSAAASLVAAKDLDERHRAGAGGPAEELGENWERPFWPEAVEAAFWETRGRAGEESLDAASGRERFFAFRSLAEELRRRLAGAPRFLPIYENTGRYIEKLLSQTKMREEIEAGLAAVARLDPFFTLNLLQLGNVIYLPNGEPLASVPETFRRIGLPAVIELAGRLAGSEMPRLSDDFPFARALRRACLATAIGAEHLAAHQGARPESAYTAGLLHAVPYFDLLEAVSRITFPSGPFRAASIETFRPVAGSVRARATGLPSCLEEAMSDRGQDDAGPETLCTREARKFFPSCTFGPVFGTAQEAPRRVRKSVASVFESLDLGTV